MKKLVMTAFAAAFSLGASAFEKYMIRVPDELNPQEGIKGVTTYFFAPAAVSIPLKDGNWIYIVNETPKQESEGGPAQIGVPKKIVELDVVSRYLEAMKGFPSITVQIGESTFFAYRCRDMFPAQDGLFLNNCYQGLVVSMGSEYSISVYLPDGRGFDDEVRGILKRVTFVPCPGTAVESALKLYGPGSLVPVASRFPIVKKMVERRGECSELIELLSTLTDDAATKAWCAERLKLINPGKYAPDTRASIPYYDYNDDAQQKAVMEMLGASKDAAKAVVTVPGGFAEPKPDSQAAPKAARSKSAPESSRAAYAAGKTKTITLPGGATMEMIYCPPGTFVMGSPEDEPGRAKSDNYTELKPRKVTLTKGFWLGKYEVTQGQFLSVMGHCPKNPNVKECNGNDLPVEYLSWEGADAFLKKVGNGARLPTEAEWEYACRADTTTPFPWGKTCNGTECNCNGTEPYETSAKGPNLERLSKGGSYPPNAWGFCDMNGNVFEWCSDWWNVDFNKTASDAVDPQGPGEDKKLGPRKVRRGGTYCHSAKNCRSATRSMTYLFDELPGGGFRMAMDDM